MDKVLQDDTVPMDEYRRRSSALDDDSDEEEVILNIKQREEQRKKNLARKRNIQSMVDEMENQV